MNVAIIDTLSEGVTVLDSDNNIVDVFSFGGQTFFPLVLKIHGYLPDLGTDDISTMGTRIAALFTWNRFPIGHAVYAVPVVRS